MRKEALTEERITLGKAKYPRRHAHKPDSWNQAQPVLLIALYVDQEPNWRNEMNGLSRLASLMMAAAISSIAAAGRSTLGDIGGGPKPLRPPKTKAPSASVGGRAYGRNKFGTTAAFIRHAKKLRNVRRHRAACR